MPILLKKDTPLGLETRKNTPIKNTYCTNDPDDGEKKMVEDYKLTHPDVIHRPVGPSPAYNCHGLTFGARRTGINDPQDVTVILNEDGYRRLANEPVLPGDIAIYVQAGEISHSGIVVFVQSQIPWILSKWGRLHEAIHKPLDCPYKESSVSYYRLEK